MRSMVVVLVMWSSLATADDVNLLVSAPTTIAVSSTVANARILPEHLADGKLSTAWNSKTGELVGAWIAVRVPANARVKAIKLTAGFAHKDKQGDLFTMNPRIKKVRVSQGTKVSEHVLDVAQRGLQTIAVDLAGGDFAIRVVEIVPGSKPSWKETCVSELEVWGTVPVVVKSKPSVRIGGLDAAATLTREQCIKALFPSARGRRIGPDRDDATIVDVEALPINAQHVVCRVDHRETGSTTTTHAFAAVKRAPRPALLGAPETPTTETEDRPDEGTGDRGEIKLEPVPLTTKETALLVHVTQHAYGPMVADSETQSTLYRVTATGLVDVFAFKSTSSGGEADRSDTCELRTPKVGKAMPSLVLDCVERRGDWHDPDPALRGITETDRVERFVWKGGRYAPK